MRLHFIQPGKPTQNAFIESFNSTIRRECLNAHWFGDLGAARQSIETWREEYNEQRPHKKIGRIPPATFAAKVEKARLKELESVQQQVVGKKG